MNRSPVDASPWNQESRASARRGTAAAEFAVEYVNGSISLELSMAQVRCLLVVVRQREEESGAG